MCSEPDLLPPIGGFEVCNDFRQPLKLSIKMTDFVLDDELKGAMMAFI